MQVRVAPTWQKRMPRSPRSLFLAGVVGRTRDFGIIRAIGGRRRQIIANLLTGSLVLASMARPRSFEEWPLP